MYMFDVVACSLFDRLLYLFVSCNIYSIWSLHGNSLFD